jgi:tetratricopeptide (TPR) repeat protein
MAFAKAFLIALIACGLPSVAIAADVRSAALKPEDKVLPTRQLGLSEHSSTDELALVLECMISLGNGEFRDVQKQCAEAVKLDDHDPAPHKLRGASYLFQKSFEQARLDFQEASRLDPTDAEDHAGYGEALRGQGKYDKAIHQFDIAVRLAPFDVRMWNARCWTRGSFGRDLNKGLSDCNAALALAPGQADILDSRGLIYLRLGKLKLAERDFSASLRQSPHLATALYGRGIVKLRRGDTRGAQQDILTARTIDQNMDDVFFWQPLISQKCLTGIMQDHGWRCRPSKRPSAKSPPPASRTAAARQARLTHTGYGASPAQ